MNNNLRKTESHERLLSNEWSNVANKKFYDKKIFSAVKGTFPSFSNFPDPGIILDYTRTRWVGLLKDPFPYLDILSVV